MKNLCKNPVIIQILVELDFIDTILQAQIQDVEKSLNHCDRNFLIALINVINLLQKLIGRVDGQINSEICVKIANFPGVILSFVKIASENFSVNGDLSGTLNGSLREGAYFWA